MNITSAVNKSRIKRLLLELSFTFNEDESRMNWGHIGNIMYKDDIAVVIFAKCFYVHNDELSINTKMVELIQLIQKELRILEFKNLKPQLLFTKG